MRLILWCPGCPVMAFLESWAAFSWLLHFLEQDFLALTFCATRRATWWIAYLKRCVKRKLPLNRIGAANREQWLRFRRPQASWKRRHPKRQAAVRPQV